MDDLCIVPVSSLSPSNQMKVQLLFEFLWNERMTNGINKILDVFDKGRQQLLHRDSSGGCHFNCMKYMVECWKNLSNFCMEYLAFIAANHTLIIIKICFPCPQVNIRIFYNMVLLSEPLFVKDYSVLFRSYQSFLDINRNF